MREWNTLATSLEGRRPELHAALRPLGVFWGAGYRNVLLGHVEDHERFFDAVRARLSTDAALEGSLTKVVPVERVATFEAATLVEAAAALVVPEAARLAGKTFYVRVERRGLKGLVHTPTVERLVGEVAIEAAARCGATPAVRFEDPDVIVAIETAGTAFGVGFLPRELRRRYPFVRVP
jgi:tRNA(Ser,Leu) C12 N-acetylase TAN1